MKRILTIISILTAAAMFFTACSGRNTATISENESKKISVVATIFPQYDFIRQIAGDNVELSMLLPPGAESHSFDPTPQDIIRIQNSDMFIYVGGESDSWIDDILSSMDTSNMEIVSLMNLVDIVEEEIVEGMEDEHGHEHDDDSEHSDGDDHEHDDDGEHEEAAEQHDDSGHDDSEHEVEYDEHVWTSPRNAIIIVQSLSDMLCVLDPANASIYEQNTASYLEELENLDNTFKEAVSAGSRKTLVFGDRFPFRYFADAYGLDYFAAFPGCSTETEASASTVAFLIDKVKEENIPAVFHIEFSNEKMADTISEATGAEKLLLHSCHNITKDDFENGITYLELMTCNVDTLKEALQ